jgi:hypothetical protein
MVWRRTNPLAEQFELLAGMVREAGEAQAAA